MEGGRGGVLSMCCVCVIAPLKQVMLAAAAAYSQVVVSKLSPPYKSKCVGVVGARVILLLEARWSMQWVPCYSQEGCCSRRGQGRNLAPSFVSAAGSKWSGHFFLATEESGPNDPSDFQLPMSRLQG